MNRVSTILGRHANGGTVSVGKYDMYEKPFNADYPRHLHYDYKDNYSRYTPHEYAKIVKDEIETCRVNKSEKNDTYKLWFGKYKGELLHNITDMSYLYYICDMNRNTNKRLVGQALLRIDQYHEQLKEEYNKKSYPPVSKRNLRKIRSKK
jgi:hypothetical protein